MNYPCLVVSEKIEDLQRADLVVIQNFANALERLKKKIRAGAGLEVQIAQARAMDAKMMARWLVQIRDLYQFCRRTRCQLVVSSGATSPWGMVSGRSFDALLEQCDIIPERYWSELEGWLESRLDRRVTI